MFSIRYFLLRSDELDLEKSWPELAGNKDSIRCRIVCNSIEDIRRSFLRGLQQTFQIDPGADISSEWRDAGNAIRLPDVGLDFSLNVFEFVEVLQW